MSSLNCRMLLPPFPPKTRCFSAVFACISAGLCIQKRAGFRDSLIRAWVLRRISAGRFGQKDGETREVGRQGSHRGARVADAITLTFWIADCGLSLAVIAASGCAALCTWLKWPCCDEFSRCASCGTTWRFTLFHGTENVTYHVKIWIIWLFCCSMQWALSARDFGIDFAIGRSED